MQLGALFRRWTASSRVHQLVQNRNSPLVSSNFLPLLALELETLLDGAIQDFAARSLLVSTLETLSTQAGRDAVESFLFNRFHERGTLVPSLNELRADGTVSNPEAWRPFLNGVVVVQAGWGLTDRIRLDRASVRAEFHRWYLTHYLSFVEHYIKTYGDYPAHETNEMLNLIRVSRGQTR